uniref:(California timema) hypothetical protein n=1 Tax=Timema californicum TaxID=61474 RepID=A0A7R9J8U3_TIMCA|nr:unnamed protein product [Timema californicum]
MRSQFEGVLRSECQLFGARMVPVSQSLQVDVFKPPLLRDRVGITCCDKKGLAAGIAIKTSWVGSVDQPLVFLQKKY